jgi:hypothetical protein
MVKRASSPWQGESAQQDNSGLPATSNPSPATLDHPTVIVILASLAILVVYASYARVARHFAWWVNVVLTMVLFAVHMLEIQLLSPATLFPFLDEPFFVRNSQVPFAHLASSGLARYNGYLIYAHLAQVATPEWILKSVNIPWLWIFMVQLYRMSGSSPWSLRLFPIALPYLYFLSFMNMRDMIGLVVIMMLTTMVTTRVRHLDCLPARIIAIAVALVLLGSLRPQWIVFFAASVSVLAMIVGRARMRLATAVLAITAAGIAYPMLSSQFDRLRVVAAYSVLTRTSETVQSLGTSQFGIESGIVGVLRQLITPLPTSKIVALTREQPGENLYLIEVARIIMNTWFISALVLVAWRFRDFVVYVRLRSSVFLFGIFAAVNTIVYGVYFFGVGSSRNKVLPIILVFMYVCHILDKRNAMARTVVVQRVATVASEPR